MAIKNYWLDAGDGGRLHIRDTGGDGMPILMLHGSSASGAVFARQFESPLAQRHRLIAIDLPGHGASDDAAEPEKAYAVNTFAGTISSAIAALKIDRVVIFGWSLGGHVALQMAPSNPAIAGILLCGTPPIARGPLGLLRGFQKHWDMLLTTKAVFNESDAERFARLCFGDEPEPAFVEAIRRADGRMRAHFFRSLLHGLGIDQKAFVESADLPIGIINGDLDPFIRLTYIEDIGYRRLWRQRCHRIPAVGHAPFWHAPELFNPLVQSFAAFAEEDIRARAYRRYVA